MTLIHFLIADQLPEFLLSGNPWLCDCNMEWLLSINQRATGYPRVLDLDSVQCHLNGQVHANSSHTFPVLQVRSWFKSTKYGQYQNVMVTHPYQKCRKLVVLLVSSMWCAWSFWYQCAVTLYNC